MSLTRLSFALRSNLQLSLQCIIHRPDYPRIYTEVDLLALSKTVDLLASRLGMGSKEVQDTIRFFEMSANFSTESASSGDDDQLHDCNVESPHSPATLSPPTQSRHDSLCAPEGAGASPTSSSVDEDLCFTVSQVEAPVEQKQQAPQPDGVPVFVQEFGNTLLSPPYQYGATQEYFSSALFADTPSCSAAPRLSTFQPPTFGEIADIAQFPGVTDSPSPFPLNIWSLVSTAHGDQLTSRNPFATVAFERPLPLNLG